MEKIMIPEELADMQDFVKFTAACALAGLTAADVSAQDPPERIAERAFEIGVAMHAQMVKTNAALARAFFENESNRGKL
jgi:hypothetical protein